MGEVMEKIKETEQELELLQKLVKEKQDMLFCLIYEASQKGEKNNGVC